MLGCNPAAAFGLGVGARSSTDEQVLSPEAIQYILYLPGRQNSGSSDDQSQFRASDSIAQLEIAHDLSD